MCLSDTMAHCRITIFLFFFKESIALLRADTGFRLQTFKTSHLNENVQDCQDTQCTIFLSFRNFNPFPQSEPAQISFTNLSYLTVCDILRS